MSADLIVQSNEIRNDYIASCVAAFSISSESEENYRKLPKFSIDLLLIPSENEQLFEFSLPSSFINKNESSLQTIRRELYEKASISKCYVEQLYTFTEFTNTPTLNSSEKIAHDNVSTISHIALINKNENYSPFAVQENTTSKQAHNHAKWFKISYEYRRTYYEKDMQISVYLLELTHNETFLSATILQKKNENELENTVEVTQAKGISPISAQIISYAITRLRGKIEYTDIAFRLLPHTFSIKTLQKVYELVLGKSLLDANFRRKILPKLSEMPDNIAENSQSLGHRKAKLYTLKKNTIHSYEGMYQE